MTEQLKSALALAAAGYRVFPVYGVKDGRCTCGREDCTSPGKHPVIKKWQTAATTDEGQIKTWWQGCNLNPAIVTGGGLVVLDVDGVAGLESLCKLEEEYGRLPETRLSLTGGGGRHYFFRSDKPFQNSAGRIGKGLDIRADGGYIVAPGAMHARGKRYEWEVLRSPEDVDEADLPVWLEKLICGGGAKEDFTPTNGALIPEGQRNNSLFKHGSFLRGQRGYTARQIEKAVEVQYIGNIKV